MKAYQIYHRTLCTWLGQKGLQYVEEYPVDIYSLDIYIPELKLGVEVDGSMHKLTRKRDAIRDANILDLEGIPIVRIPVGTSKTKALKIILER